MPTVRLTNGIEIDCKTIEETRAVFKEFAAEIAPGGVRRKKKQKRSDRVGGSPGKGPMKLWRMAEWYAAKIGATKNEARSQLTKTKREDARKFLDLEEEFQRFTEWAAKKLKIPQEQITESLATMSDEEPERYKTLVSDFSKKKS